MCDDVFEEALQVEQRAYTRGMHDGIVQGEKEGYLMGKDVGHKKGLELVSELGVYKGFCDTLLRLHEKQPNHLNVSLTNRELKALHSAVESVEQAINLARTHPLKLSLLPDAMEAARAKFKTLISVLGGQPRQLLSSSDSSLSF